MSNEYSHHGPRDCGYADTVAYKCRWSDLYTEHFANFRVIWEESKADYQGRAAVLAVAPDRSYRWASWYYGSCSGCDGREGMSDAQLAADAKGDMETIAQADMPAWLAKRDAAGYRSEADSIRAAIAQAGLS